MITLNTDGLNEQEINKFNNLKPAISYGIIKQQQDGQDLSSIKSMINKGFYTNKFYELQKSYSKQIINSKSLMELSPILSEIAQKQKLMIKSDKDRNDQKLYLTKALKWSFNNNKFISDTIKEEFISRGFTLINKQEIE